MDKLGNTLKETQEQLIKLLGFDYEVFRTTSCFEQNASDAFSQLNPKEAKLLIMKLLQLDVYERYERIARDIVNNLDPELSKLAIKKSTVEDSMKTQSVDVEKLQREIQESEQKLNMLQTNKPLVEKVIDIKQKVFELRQNKQKFSELEKCPTCLQDINKGHKESIVKKFEDHINKLLEGIVPGLDDADEKQLRNIEYEISLAQSLIARNKAILEQNEKKVQTEKSYIAELDKKITTLEDETAIYKKLVTAFGRNGIPALIIENSIPEVENIANTLLEELEIDMQLRLELQKELKSGELADTLEILICRDKWQMSYFNYSGGERFLIDLVLRIALSVLLLRRKGCSNSTLIIDEGFGNLDKVNREKALKLISIINERFGFQKIIIISHVSEIQDSIGTKIRIVKRGQESIVEG